MMQIRKRDWLIPILLLAVMAIIVVMSPEERTLGARIKVVYVHVAFIWSGLAGILISGLLSFTVFWKPLARRLEKVLPILNLVSVISFGIGFILSAAAAKVNWGSVAWTEPRMISSSRIIAVAVIVQVLVFMIANIRWRAGFYVIFLLFTVATNATVKNAIHPDNPIFSSDSNSFAIVVLSLTGIVVLLALWFINLGIRGKNSRKSDG